MMSMNFTPPMPDAGGDFLEKLRVIPFRYKFVERVEYPEFQKQIDTGLKTKFEDDPRYRQQFMRMLLRQFREKELHLGQWHEPSEVIDAARDELFTNDPLAAFVNRIGPSLHILNFTGVNNDKVPVVEVERMFNTYMRLTNERYTPWDHRTFLRAMCKIGHQQVSSNSQGWYRGFVMDPNW